MLGSLNGMKITSIGGRSQYTGSVRTGKPTTRAVSFRDGSVPQKNDFAVHDTTKPNHQLVLWYMIPQKGILSRLRVVWDTHIIIIYHTYYLT